MMKKELDVDKKMKYAAQIAELKKTYHDVTVTETGKVPAMRKNPAAAEIFSGDRPYDLPPPNWA